MPQAHVDPERLRDFVYCLRSFHDHLHEHKQQVVFHLRGLEDVWNDQVQERFEHELMQAMNVLERLLDKVDDEYIPYLEVKIEDAERYLEG